LIIVFSSRESADRSWKNRRRAFGHVANAEPLNREKRAAVAAGVKKRRARRTRKQRSPRDADE
jgi:hypothetical protein